MAIRFLPLLLIVLSLNCFVGASGQGEDPQSTGAGFSSNAEASSSTLVLIATVTPVPQAEAQTRLAALASSTPNAASTAGATVTPTAAATEAVARIESLATDTPQPTETPTALPSETPSATETFTPTVTATGTATASPTPTKTRVPTQTPTATPVTPTVVSFGGMSMIESSIFQAHNQIRSDHDLPMFVMSPQLMTIARQRAETMAQTGRFSHTNPDGTNVFDMMTAIGYRYVTGSENIHYNYGYPPQQSWQVAMDAWLNSPPHYASLVNPSLGHIGIGVATASDGYIYYSVVFSD